MNGVLSDRISNKLHMYFGCLILNMVWCQTAVQTTITQKILLFLNLLEATEYNRWRQNLVDKKIICLQNIVYFPLYLYANTPHTFNKLLASTMLLADLIYISSFLLVKPFHKCVSVPS